MMGSENQGFKEAPLFSPKGNLETLLPLHRDVDSDSDDRLPYPVALHPLSDPLLSPPSPNSNPHPHDIDPPSYADVVFTPFDSSDINGGDSTLDTSSSRIFSLSNSSDFIKITVSNPQKEQEPINSLVPGSNTFVTYLITTRTNIPNFGGSDFSVRRRFRDVVTLSQRLSKSYRGFVIPPRPDKSVLESQVMQIQEFVEQRRVALEKYLWRLAAHPVFRKSDELKMFLQVKGNLPLLATTDVGSRMLDGAVKIQKKLPGDGPAVAPQEAGKPAKGRRELLRLFKELKQSIANDWGSSKPPMVEEDKEFLEKKDRMQDLELQLSNASQQAEALVKAQQDMGETMGELGLAFIKLTKFENEEAMFNAQRVRAADMKNLATATVKASRFYRELNLHTVKHLDTLHENLGLMIAVDCAFADRSSALLTVQTLLSELSSFQSRSDKLEAASSKIFGGDKTRVQKLEELKETIRVTEDAKNAAIRQYERITENNRSELERLDTERQADFLNMLKGFVVNQAGYAEKIANVWGKVAEEMSSYARESS